MTLLDLKEYIQIKEQMFLDFEDRLAWSRKMLYNIGASGIFFLRPHNKRILSGYLEAVKFLWIDFFNYFPKYHYKKQWHFSSPTLDEKRRDMTE